MRRGNWSNYAGRFTQAVTSPAPHRAGDHFILYAGTATLGFVYDDVLQVLGSPSIRSWGHIREYFTQPVISTLYYCALVTAPMALSYFNCLSGHDSLA
jgi:hypothetical protein